MARTDAALPIASMVARTAVTAAVRESGIFETPGVAEAAGLVTSVVPALTQRAGAAASGGGSARPAARVGDPVGSHGARSGGAGGGGVMGLAMPIAGALAGSMLGGLGGVISSGLGAVLRLVSGNPSLSGGCAHVASGSPNVIIEGQPVARGGDDRHSHGANARLVEGSATVFVNGRPLVRVGDRASCSGVVTSGAARTIIGGGTTTAGSGGRGGVGAALASLLRGGLMQIASNQVAALIGGLVPGLPAGLSPVLTGALQGAMTGGAAGALQGAMGGAMNAATGAVGSAIGSGMQALTAEAGVTIGAFGGDPAMLGTVAAGEMIGADGLDGASGEDALPCAADGVMDGGGDDDGAGGGTDDDRIPGATGMMRPGARATGDGEPGEGSALRGGMTPEQLEARHTVQGMRQVPGYGTAAERAIQAELADPDAGTLRQRLDSLGASRRAIAMTLEPDVPLGQSLQFGTMRQGEAWTPMSPGGRYGAAGEEISARLSGLGAASYTVTPTLDGEPMPVSRWISRMGDEFSPHEIAMYRMNPEAPGIAHTSPEVARRILTALEPSYRALATGQVPLAEVMPRVGALHYWLAQAMPMERGSASVADMTARYLMERNGIVAGAATEPLDLRAMVTTSPDEFAREYASRFTSVRQANGEAVPEAPRAPGTGPAARGAAPDTEEGCTTCRPARPVAASDVAETAERTGMQTSPDHPADTEADTVDQRARQGAPGEEEGRQGQGDEPERAAAPTDEPERASAQTDEPERAPADAPEGRRTVPGPNGTQVEEPSDARQVFERARNSRTRGEFGFGEQGIYQFNPETGETTRVLGHGYTAMQEVPREMRMSVMQQGMEQFRVGASRMLAVPDGANGAFQLGVRRTADAFINGIQNQGDAARAGLPFGGVDMPQLPFTRDDWGR